MADSNRDSLRALIGALVPHVREEARRRQLHQRNGGSIVLWPFVAEIMLRITGETRTPKAWRNFYDGFRKYPADVQERMVESVKPEVYEEILLAVLDGTAPTQAEPAGKKPWVPPPSRSENPDERIEERKAEILRQHDRRVAEKLVDQKAITEMLVDAVREGAQLAPPIVWRSAPEVLIRPDAAEEIPVALLGDIHVGTLVDPEEMGGLGEYDFEILKRRLNTYQTRIAQAIDLHRRQCKISRMLVYMLGDMVEGEVIFDGQAFRIELITVDQLFEGSSYIIGWLQGLLATGLVEHIHVACIYGNHGRTQHKKGSSKAHSNWDYVMYCHMREVLRHEPRISWFIPKAWFAIVDVMGWRIYGTHGDVIKSWMGIPFYGIQRHDMRTTTLLQSVDTDYKYWVCGDKHVSATIPRVTGAQIMNGSTVGGSDFSMHQLGTASEPMQTLFGIHEQYGKSWQYDFVLDRRDPENIRKHLALMKI